MKRNKKQRLKEIQKRLKTQLLSNSNSLFNGSYVGEEKDEERYLWQDVVELRTLGVEIKLPVSYTAVSCVTLEMIAEVIRQIENACHPIKTWFLNHLNVIISICALVVSIISVILKI